ncbi:MAG: hypothetical protein IPG48_15135 [Saprospiraceae bacterium]|nr:hypothetical protein [Saprospiraceae bacterium]
MTQELYDFLISQPVIDGKTMLFIYENQPSDLSNDNSIKHLVKVEIPNIKSINVSIFVKVKGDKLNTDTHYSGQKTFSDAKNYNLTVNQFINNLNSLLNYRHKDSIPPDFIKIADIKTH